MGFEKGTYKDDANQNAQHQEPDRIIEAHDQAESERGGNGIYTDDASIIGEDAAIPDQAAQAQPDSISESQNQSQGGSMRRVGPKTIKCNKCGRGPHEVDFYPSSPYTCKDCINDRRKERMAGEPKRYQELQPSNNNADQDKVERKPAYASTLTVHFREQRDKKIFEKVMELADRERRTIDQQMLYLVEVGLGRRSVQADDQKSNLGD
jgi:hypothetical protein